MTNTNQITNVLRVIVGTFVVLNLSAALGEKLNAGNNLNLSNAGADLIQLSNLELNQW